MQTDLKTGEPLLLQVMLPECIRQRNRAKDAYVFVLDAQVRIVSLYIKFLAV